MVGFNVSEEFIVAELSQQPVFPGGKRCNKLIQTHASNVFIVGDEVYKTKRWVKYRFLDYSTLEKRKYFCELEFDLNKRYAPGLYIGVECVSFSSNQLVFGDPTAVVDYALHMRKFDDQGLLSELLERGALNEDYMEEVARVIAQFHQSAERVPRIGGSSRLREVVLQNVETLLEVHVPESLSSLTRTAITNITAELSNAFPLLRARDSDYIRAVHGDLHLRNICLLNGRPTLFDGIEFSEDLRCIDVLLDLAFLVMDLLVRNRPDLGFLTLNTYLEHTDDFQGLSLMRLYLAHRALVRATVEDLRVSKLSSEEIEPAIRPYLEFAVRVLEWNLPMLIAVGGLSGSGKSFVAKSLAQTIGAVVIRSDALRKRLAGIGLTQKAPASAYSDNFSENVYQEILMRAELALRMARPVIVDATFINGKFRNAFRNWAQQKQIPFVGFWCSVSPDLARARIIERLRSCRDPSDADPGVLEEQLQRDPGVIKWEKIDTSGQVGDLVAALKTRLNLR